MCSPAPETLSAPPLGAKLGAILCGFRQTAVACGLGHLSGRAAWTVLDPHGHRLEIYGSPLL